MKTYFTPDFVAFLHDLEANNNRDWFQENKSRFENKVKLPFESFIADVIGRLRERDQRIPISPKDAIFRIHRDTRFGQDKSPYKTHMSALITAGGKKDHASEGVYIELAGNHARMYSGVHMPSKEQLQAIREKIAKESGRFAKLIADPTFVSLFGEVRGEKNKILPPEIKAAAASQPLLFNKAFYYFTEWPAKAVIKPGFLDEMIKRYEVCLPLNAFLQEAIHP